jgi:HK97 family phage portal protein
MSLLESIVRGLRGGLRASGDPNDERYWLRAAGPVYLSQSGVRVTPALALQVSVLFQGIRIVAEMLGSLPRKLYREREDGGKDLAKDHPLWPLVRRNANAWQTTQQWVETMTAQAILWGRGYSEIVPGRRGAVDQLVPLTPGNFTVEQLDNYRIRARVQEPGRPERILVQEQLFRLEGLTFLGVQPLELLEAARNSVGLWLAMEKFNANFFAQGARPSLAVQKLNVRLDGEARRKAVEAFQQSYGGVENMHKVMFVDHGGEVKEFGFSARDAQMTEARDKHAIQFASWLNLPEHFLRVGAQPKYGKLEEVNQELVDVTLRPWAVRFEQAFQRDLLDDDDDVCLEFLFDALLRGSVLDRYQAHGIGIMNGFLAENEARAKENLNPHEGLWTPRRSVNQDRGAEPRAAGEAKPPRRDDPPPARDDDEENDAIAPISPAVAEILLPKVTEAMARKVNEMMCALAAPAQSTKQRRLALIAEEAARRVVRKETADLAHKAAKLAGRADAWRDAVAAFYAEHAPRVAETLQLEPAVARAYCDRHRDELLAAGVAALERWETAAVRELTHLALEETADVDVAA